VRSGPITHPSLPQPGGNGASPDRTARDRAEQDEMGSGGTLLHGYANLLKRSDTSESVNLHKCLILLDSGQIYATRWRQSRGFDNKYFFHYTILQPYNLPTTSGISMRPLLRCRYGERRSSFLGKDLTRQFYISRTQTGGDAL
jgi:hypothetical protein